MKAGARFLSRLLPPDQSRVQTFVVPALRKLREGRGTPLGGGASDIKGWATRPVYEQRPPKGGLWFLDGFCASPLLALFARTGAFRDDPSAASQEIPTVRFSNT